MVTSRSVFVCTARIARVIAGVPAAGCGPAARGVGFRRKHYVGNVQARRGKSVKNVLYAVEMGGRILDWAELQSLLRVDN